MDLAVETQARCSVYRRRRPERPPLYRAVQGHLETYLALAREGHNDGDGVPQYVKGASPALSAAMLLVVSGCWARLAPPGAAASTANATRPNKARDRKSDMRWVNAIGNNGPEEGTRGPDLPGGGPLSYFHTTWTLSRRSRFGKRSIKPAFRVAIGRLRLSMLRLFVTLDTWSPLSRTRATSRAYRRTRVRSTRTPPTGASAGRRPRATGRRLRPEARSSWAGS